MKYLVFLFAVSLSAQTIVSTGNHRKLFPAIPAGWTGAKIITVDHTKIGSADLTNYPVLISGTYSYLATIANGGSVTSGSGWDIEFYADSALTTKLPWEIASWSATTGAVIYWVQIPTVSHTTDTVFYMAYGNSGVTTDQSNKTGTWNSNFKIVWHNDTLSGGITPDSTSNANNGSTPGGIGTVAGLIANASTNTSTSPNYILVASNSGISGMAGLTASTWFKTTLAEQCVGGTGESLISKHNSGTNGEWGLCVGGSTATNNQITGFVTNTTPTRTLVTANLSSGTYTDGNWHYAVETWDGSTMTIYFDGVSIGSSAATGAMQSTPTNSLRIFAFAAVGGGGTNSFQGSIDEARLSNAARSASWVLADYNSQSSPSTFYAVTTLF